MNNVSIYFICKTIKLDYQDIFLLYDLKNISGWKVMETTSSLGRICKLYHPNTLNQILKDFDKFSNNFSVVEKLLKLIIIRKERICLRLNSQTGTTEDDDKSIKDNNDYFIQKYKDKYCNELKNIGIL